MHEILPLKKGVRYILEDVERISFERDSSGGAHYELIVNLSFEDKGIRRSYRLSKPGVKLQLAKELHLGAEWKDGKEYIPKHWLEFKLSSNIFQKPTNQTYDNQILSEEYLCSLQSRKGKDYLLTKRLITFKCDPVLNINGKQLQFIVVPSFEIARYFHFEANKYNELLLLSDFEGDPSKNLIFNPKKSCTSVNEDGIEIRHVHLRKGIEDSCAQKAANLASNGFYQKQMRFLSEIVQSLGGKKNIHSFFGMKLPVNQFDELKVLGDYVKDKEGKDGLRINVILDALPDNYIYSFSRDNDSRSVAEVGEGLPITNSKRKKNRNTKKPKNPSINHQESADDDFDAEQLKPNSEFSKYAKVDKAVKIEKIDQETKAKIFTEILDKIPKGYSGQGKEGGKGSGFQAVDNSLDDSKFITEEKYWLLFENILNEIKEAWKDLKMEFWDITTEAFVHSNKPRLLLTDDLITGYLIQLCYNKKCAYLLEFNQSEISKNTLIFQKRDKSSIEESEIKKILGEIESGIKLADLRSDFNLETNGVVHRMHYNDTDKKSGEPIKTKDAIDQFTQRVINYLKPMVS